MTEPKTFFISDTHFGHKNIIKYCHRPFKSVEEMDQTIIENWNRVVGKDDIVFFVGDFCFGDCRKYLKQLYGHITFIKGNHDSHKIARQHRTRDHVYIQCDDIPFYVTHDPKSIVSFWTKWSITGHVHDIGPFIDSDKKIINVSVEQINYTPIRIEEIIDRIRNV